MTEEIEDNNIAIPLEQILAALIGAKGPIAITLDELMTNYGGKQISITQDDNDVVFELVDVND